MFCKHCGTKIPDGATKCRQCGSVLGETPSAHGQMNPGVPAIERKPEPVQAPSPSSTSETGVAPDKPKWGGVEFGALCVLSLGFAIVGIPVGASNLKYPSRHDQAKTILTLGIVSLVLGLLLASAG